MSVSTRGQTDMRGLVTAGRAVRLERIRILEIERDPQAGLMIAHSCSAGRSTRCDHSFGGVLAGHLGGSRCYSRTASDQHQPASSRAIATLAMTGFFFRSVKTCQR